MRVDCLHTWYIQLTDRCTHACAHCFLTCSPAGRAVMSVSGARRWIHQFAAVSRGRMVFTGGEPFLYFAMMRNLVHEAAAAGFSPAVWTNGYWATGPDEFRLSLRYLADVGLSELIVSDDAFHGEAPFTTWKDQMSSLARELGVALRFAAITPKPAAVAPDFLFEDTHILEGPVMHRGRAAETCTPGQTLWQAADFDACPFVSFESPRSLFLDAQGFLHICPGFPLADLNRISIKRFLAEFDIQRHPAAHAIAAGGPAELARRLSVDPATGFVDYCHACWTLRRRMASIP